MTDVITIPMRSSKSAKLFGLNDAQVQAMVEPVTIDREWLVVRLHKGRLYDCGLMADAIIAHIKESNS